MPDVATLALTISAVALLFALYVGLRGYGWVRRRERPEKIIGRVVRFADVESDRPMLLPPARVVSFDAGSYIAEFALPLRVDGREYNTIRLSARHAGFPISSVSKWRMLAATGDLPGGHGFIALIKPSDA